MSSSRSNSSMTTLPSPGTTASGTATHMQYDNYLPSMQPSAIASPHTSGSLSGAGFNITTGVGNNKRKRRPAGTPDPDAEVVALSPKTLMESDRYVCEICGQGFQRDQNLQMHRRRHKVPWKLLKRTSPDIRKRVYVCPEPSCLHHDPCHALGDLVGIKKHYRRKHSCNKQWKCEKCSKGYAVQSDYKAHLKTCGTRGHCCDCGRVFSRVESFIEHQDSCSAAREKTAIASSDQTSLASLSARNGSPSPSVDTLSATNRSGGSVAGVVQSLDSSSRYEATAGWLTKRELQLLPMKQFVESSESSALGGAVNQDLARNLLGKPPQAVAFRPLETPSDAAPRLQLSIGLSCKASHETPPSERTEDVDTKEAVSARPELLASTAGSRRSLIMTDAPTSAEKVVNRRLCLSPQFSTRDEPNLEALASERVYMMTEYDQMSMESSRNQSTTPRAETRAHEERLEGGGCGVSDWAGMNQRRKATKFEAAALPEAEARCATRGKRAANVQTEMDGSSSRHRCAAALIKEALNSGMNCTSAIEQERRVLDGHGFEGAQGRMLQQQQQLKRACAEKLLAEEARVVAKKERQVAEAELAQAQLIREHAQAELRKALLYLQHATRLIHASVAECHAYNEEVTKQQQLPPVDLASHSPSLHHWQQQPHYPHHHHHHLSSNHDHLHHVAAAAAAAAATDSVAAAASHQQQYRPTQHPPPPELHLPLEHPDPCFPTPSE